MKKVLFILGELDNADIDWIIATSRRETIETGTVLIYEGQPIDTLYILLEGELSVSTAAVSGREIATLSAGEIVGEMSFVDTRPPSATVKAKQPSLVLSIPRTQLVTKLQEDVAFSSRFYRALAVFLSNRLRVTVNQLGYGTDAQIPTEKFLEAVIERSGQDDLSHAQTRLDWLLQRLRSDSLRLPEE